MHIYIYIYIYICGQLNATFAYIHILRFIGKPEQSAAFCSEMPLFGTNVEERRAEKGKGKPRSKKNGIREGEVYNAKRQEHGDLALSQNYFLQTLYS
jgi:hypothetical protein